MNRPYYSRPFRRHPTPLTGAHSADPHRLLMFRIHTEQTWNDRPLLTVLRASGPPHPRLVAANRRLSLDVNSAAGTVRNWEAAMAGIDDGPGSRTVAPVRTYVV